MMVVKWGWSGEFGWESGEEDMKWGEKE